METYFLNINELSKEDISLTQRYFPKRFKKALAYNDENKFLQCVGVSYLLYRYLHINNEDLLQEDQYGKPFLTCGPFINYAHSCEMVILAVNDSPVGVDIEKIDAKNLSYSSRIFPSKEEQEYISKNPLNNFHELWTRKEAILKYFGDISLNSKINVPIGISMAHFRGFDLKINSYFKDNYSVTIVY